MLSSQDLHSRSTFSVQLNVSVQSASLVMYHVNLHEKIRQVTLGQSIPTPARPARPARPPARHDRRHHLLCLCPPRSEGRPCDVKPQSPNTLLAQFAISNVMQFAKKKTCSERMWKDVQSKAIKAQISRVCPVAHPAPPQNPHHRSHLKATTNSKSLSVFPFRPSSRIWRHGKHHETSRDITSHHEPRNWWWSRKREFDPNAAGCAPPQRLCTHLYCPVLLLSLLSLLSLSILGLLDI